MYLEVGFEKKSLEKFVPVICLAQVIQIVDKVINEQTTPPLISRWRLGSNGSLTAPKFIKEYIPVGSHFGLDTKINVFGIMWFPEM